MGRLPGKSILLLKRVSLHETGDRYRSERSQSARIPSRLRNAGCGAFDASTQRDRVLSKGLAPTSGLHPGAARALPVTRHLGVPFSRARSRPGPGVGA